MKDETYPPITTSSQRAAHSHHTRVHMALHARVEAVGAHTHVRLRRHSLEGHHVGTHWARWSHGSGSRSSWPAHVWVEPVALHHVCFGHRGRKQHGLWFGPRSVREVVYAGGISGDVFQRNRQGIFDRMHFRVGLRGRIRDPGKQIKTTLLLYTNRYFQKHKVGLVYDG